MAMIRITEQRLEEIGERIEKQLGLRSPTPDLIEEVGMDLAEQDDQFSWFTYTTDSQIMKILDWIVEARHTPVSEGIVRPYMYER